MPDVRPNHLRRREFEPLEDRLLLSVSQDANGWSVVTPSADSQLIYVSSSLGNNSNNGLTPSSPVKTFAKAQSLMRNGFPDQLLLRRGDTFVDYFTNWSKSGRSANEPILIGNYGTGARPVVDTSGQFGGFATLDTSTVNYLDIIGVEFINQVHNPNSPTFSFSNQSGVTGLEFGCAGGNLLVENCSFRYYRNNLDIEGLHGPLGNITIRRSLIADSWSNTSAHSQGMYGNEIDNVAITECVFDHNGWNEQITGAGAQGYNHNIYLSSLTTNADIENNILSNASFAGVMDRCGGIVKNNVFINDAIAVSFGNADGANSTAGGVTGEITGNIVLGDKGGVSYGEGIEVGNTKPGANVPVQNNIIVGDTIHTAAAITLTMATNTLNPSQAVGLNDVTLQNNIEYGWYRGMMIDGRFSPGGSGLYALNNLNIRNNDFIGSTNRLIRQDGRFVREQEHWAGNRYYTSALSQSSWFLLISNVLSFKQWKSAFDPAGIALGGAPYADPNRNAGTYDTALGGAGTTADFVAQARLLSDTNYRPQYMATAVADYVRNGFTVDTAAPTVTLMNVPNVSGANAAAPYQFTVTYNDNFFLNTSTFDSNDLLVTGPNGFSQKATFVSSGLVWTTSDGHDNRVVTYQIQPPGGAWSSGSDGAYTISLLANQVLDSAGNAAAGGMLTQFTVDTSAPAGSLLAAPNVDSTSLGSTTYTFAVSYSDASGIDLSSLDGNDIEVTSTTGYDALATLNGTSVNGNSVIATYSIAAPSGAWSTDAAGTYNIIQRAGEVRDTFGNTAPAGTLGTFTASFGGGPNPPPASGAISGTVFNDANGNGTIDSRELPMVGVVVYLDTNLNGQLDANEATATTDDTGQYTFNGLSDGRYTVREQSPGGYTVTSPTSGTNTATITGGTPVSGVSFANQLSSLVTGTPSATPSSPSTPTTSPTSPTTTPTSGTPTDTSKPRPKNPGRGHTVKL